MVDNNTYFTINYLVAMANVSYFYMKFRKQQHINVPVFICNVTLFKNNFIFQKQRWKVK